MPLTIDRTAYTATQLNDFFDSTKYQIAYTLPFGIREDSDGNLFESMVIDESDTLAADIETPEDILFAISTLGSVNRQIYIEIKQENVTTAITTYVNVYGTSAFSVDTKSPSYNPAEEQTTGNFAWSEAAGRYIPRSEVVKLNIFSQIQLSGLSVVKTEKVITNSSNGWFGDNFFGGELFSGTGVEQWGVTGLTASVGTTYTVMYLNDIGIGQWDNQKTYGLTDEDQWTGFPEGLSPSSGSSKCTTITEDLTSQVTGSATTFTTAREFVSDCLHVYWNGQRIRAGVEFNVINSTQFTTTFTPDAGTSITVDLVEDT